MEVSIFIPCFIDQLSPETGMHMVAILEKLGCTVKYNTNQTCCGQPAYNSGFQHEAYGIAKKFVKDFSKDEYIVSPSGSCSGYVKNYYPKMNWDNDELKQCEHTIQHVHEFTSFLTAHFDLSQLKMHNATTITYHDGCGSLRECGIKTPPRAILEHIKGVQLIEMKECETCCGFGGTFAVKFEPISTGMAYTKVHSALETGAQTIVSGDYSCLMHLNSYIEKNNLPIRTMHIIDFMYESMI